MFVHCTEICSTIVLCSARSNNGTSFEVTKRKLSHIGTDDFAIRFSFSCISVLYRVMKNVGVAYLERSVRIYLDESISDL